jgi:hypothetical protein
MKIATDVRIMRTPYDERHAPTLAGGVLYMSELPIG